MKNKFILSIVIILSIFVFLIPFISNKCYAEHSTKQNMIENLLINATGLTTSSFSSSSYYGYHVYYKTEKTDYYFFEVSSQTDFSTSVYTYAKSGKCNISLYEINSNITSIQLVSTKQYSSSGSAILKDVFSCPCLDYSNLLYLSDNILWDVAVYGFECRDEILLPYVDLDRTDNFALNNAEYIDISPANTFLIYNSNTFYTNAFTLQILEWETEDESKSYTVVYNTSLSKNDTTFWFADDLVYRIPKELLDGFCRSGICFYYL